MKGMTLKNKLFLHTYHHSALVASAHRLYYTFRNVKIFPKIIFFWKKNKIVKENEGKKKL
jgi:hypothetical protein